jgi:WD40 repeat protein
MEHRGSTGRIFPRRFFVWPGWLMVLAVLGAALAGAALISGDSGPKPGPEDRPFAQVAHDDHEALVWALAASPDTRQLASATIPGEVRLKYLTTGQSLRIQSGPWSSARSLAFSSDGRVLAIAGIEESIRFWDVEEATELAPISVAGRTMKNLAFSPDGTLLAVSVRGGEGEVTGGIVALWDWPSRRRRAVLASDSAYINGIAFARDCSSLVWGDSVGVVHMWDVATGRKRRSFRSNVRGAIVQAIAFSPDGALLATAGFLDPEVRLWDSATGDLRGIVPGTPLGVNALAFSPEGTMLVMARGDGTAVLWDLAERRLTGAVGALGGSLQSVAFLGHGRFVTGGVDGIVRHWDVAEALAVRPSLGRPDSVGPEPSPR